ncbi:MAG: hypothetical protein ACLFQB_05905 [Chitinispirillaceae bacterium]
MQSVEVSQLDPRFRKDLDKLYKAYLELANALATDSENEIKASFESLGNVLGIIVAPFHTISLYSRYIMPCAAAIGMSVRVLSRSIRWSTWFAGLVSSKL